MRGVYTCAKYHNIVLRRNFVHDCKKPWNIQVRRMCVKLSLLHSKLSVSSSSYHLRLWSLISGVIGLASVKWRELPLLHPVNGCIACVEMLVNKYYREE
jgi:hypothetical protein